MTKVKIKTFYSAYPDGIPIAVQVLDINEVNLGLIDSLNLGEYDYIKRIFVRHEVELIED